MLKASREAGRQWVTSVCNGIVKERYYPDGWRRSLLVNVCKGKGDVLACGSYHGIESLDHVMKVFDRVIEKDQIRMREVELEGSQIFIGCSLASVPEKVPHMPFLK